MTKRITLIWIIGFFTLVPYSVYRLLFIAESDEYALLITLPLFWIFGFWGVAGPLISAYKVHCLMKALENITSREKLEELVKSQSTEDIAIDLIASENGIPKFLAKKVYRRFMQSLSDSSDQSEGKNRNNHNNPDQ